MVRAEPLVVGIGSSVVSPAVFGCIAPRDEIITLVEEVVLPQRCTIQVVRRQTVELSRRHYFRFRTN